ncbi:MAG: Mrp/NBP35 family ATP-binding protein [Egibacteraceae bacterium]
MFTHRPRVAKEDVRDALAAVRDPDLDLPITELDMVRGIVIGRRQVQVGIALLVPDSPHREQLRAAVTRAVEGLGVADVHVDFSHFADDERRALRERLQGGRPRTPAQAFAGARVLAISSGKGGVGKSSVSVNLAIALAGRDKRVALLDADVYGFSIPRMIGIDRRPAIVDNLVIPPRAHGVAVISMAFFTADEQTPIVWRGPMLHKALEQFITDVHWGDVEFLLIDMPPGTGDVALTMAQFLPNCEVIVVTTPQAAAQKVAQRAAYMALKVNLTVRGVIENMSWFTGDDGVRYELFGSGGGTLLAEQLRVPLLGQIPLVPALREGGDEGRPVIVADPGSPASQAFQAIADKIIALRPRRVPLPLLNAQ